MDFYIDNYKITETTAVAGIELRTWNVYHEEFIGCISLVDGVIYVGCGKKYACWRKTRKLDIEIELALQKIREFENCE